MLKGINDEDGNDKMLDLYAISIISTDDRKVLVIYKDNSIECDRFDSLVFE